MVIFQIKIFHEINFFLIIIYKLLQFKTVHWFSSENSVDKWHSECIAICQSATIMHCNWPQFNWVKEGNNTADGQWSVTLCYDEIFTSQHVTSVYCNLKETDGYSDSPIFLVIPLSRVRLDTNISSESQKSSLKSPVGPNNCSSLFIWPNSLLRTPHSARSRPQINISHTGRSLHTFHTTKMLYYKPTYAPCFSMNYTCVEVRNQLDSFTNILQNLK